MIAHSDDDGADKGEIGGEHNLVIECCRNGTQDCEYFKDFLTFPNMKCDLMEIFFSMPTCWDGQSLGDDNDHKSHMRYTTNGKVNGPCPEGFPRRLPQIEMNANIGLGSYDGTAKTYELSDGTSIWHVDFFNGWQEGKLQEIIDQCPFSGNDAPRNPDCGCTPNLTNTNFLTPNTEKPGYVCDADVRNLIIDEATDVTQSLPTGSCQGPSLIPRSWDQITDGLFSTCDPYGDDPDESSDEDGSSDEDEESSDDSGDEDESEDEDNSSDEESSDDSGDDESSGCFSDDEDGTSAGDTISSTYGRIVIVGDSLLDGNGSTEGMVEKTLSDMLDGTLTVNNAIGGFVLDDIVENQSSCGCYNDCKWSVVNGGINGMYDQKVAKTINTMKDFVQKELSTGKEGVIIQGYPPDCDIYASGPTFNAIMDGYRDFAASTAKVWFVDPRNGLPGHPLVGQPCDDTSNTYRIEEDNSHPTPFTGELMAAEIADIIRENSNGACVDQPLAYKDNAKWNCAWVGKKADDRCKKKWKGSKLSEYCPATCDAECDDVNCVDDPTFKFKNKAKKNCAWVGKKAKQRCKKKWKGTPISDSCPQSCGSCTRRHLLKRSGQ